MKRKLRWLTLIEILVVIMITGALLAMTLYLWWDYINTMQVRTDKELFANSFDNALVTARTSNYFDWTEYETITITLTWWGVTATTNNAQTVSSHLLQDAEVIDSWSWYPDFFVEPYSIWCDINVGGETFTGDAVDFSLESTINDDVYCYSIGPKTCKLQQVSCD